jgi:hypothetical protein
MPLREFRDSAGVQWRVWETTPQPGAVYDERLKAGWLTFESGNTRKRLAPIPSGWEEAPADRLELLCRAAEPARRSGSVTGDPDAAADSRPHGRGRDAPGSK